MEIFSAQPLKQNQVRLQRIILIIALVLFLPMFVYHCNGIYELLIYPGEINFGEGMQNAETSRVLNLKDLYGDITKPPHWALTYPPLYHFLGKILGFGTISGQRLISLISSLGQCGVLVLILRRITGSYLPGVLAALMFIDSVFVAPWTVVGRTDMTGRFFSTAAIAAAFLLRDYKKAFITALLLSTMALLTKQTMFTGGFVSALILWQRHRKGGYYYIIGLGGAIALSYGILNFLTDGGFFRHTFQYVARGLEYRYFIMWMKALIFSQWQYLAAGILGIAGILFCQRQLWWMIAALLPALLNTIAIANPGADRNYFFDLIWITSLLAATACWIFASKTIAIERRPSPSQALAAFALIVLIGLLASSNKDAAFKTRTVYPNIAFRSRAQAVIDELRRTPGQMLAEYSVYEIAAGNKPEFPAYIMKLLETKGLFDSQPIIDQIQRKEFQAILLSNLAEQRYSAKVLKAIYENYHVDWKADYIYLIEAPATLYIYRPNSSAVSSETTSTLSS